MKKLSNLTSQQTIISMLCPSGYFPLQKAETCIQTLQQWGYVVQVGKTIGLQNHYFAGTDDERLHDLQQALNDPHIQAIFCARGGYGLSRIIEQLDFTAFIQHPKWVIGFSDITILHARLQRLRFPSLLAPMANAFNDGGVEGASVQSLKAVLSGQPIHYCLAPHAFNRLGNVTAPLVGGNLTIIAHLIGSADSIDTTNKILVMEDVGEYLYNVDRMLIQLRRAGMLQNLADLLVGGFTDMKDTTIRFGKTVEEIVREHVAEYNYPVAFHFPVSHGEPNLAVKLGVSYHLSVCENEVVLKEITESM
jgi:muramoyltetrapeptide carboxypeptidase